MAENDDLDLGEEKKSSNTWMIIGAVVLLLLTGGGAAAYFMDWLPFGKAVDTSDKEHEAGGGEASEEESISKDSQFYQFAPLVVNFPRGSGARLMQIKFSVLAYDEGSIKAVDKHAPMIRNNLLLLLGRYKPQDLQTAQGKLALREAILTEIQKVLDMQTDGSRIEAVFYTNFLME